MSRVDGTSAKIAFLYSHFLLKKQFIQLIMGGGSSNQQKSMKSQLEGQLKKQVQSSKYAPFSEMQIQSLQKKFKNLDEHSKGSIKLSEFKNLQEIRMHFFRDRIYQILEFEMNERDIITINFDKFVDFLSVFHPNKDIQAKQEFMFNIYDYDNDGNITQKDLTEVFNLVYMKSAQLNKPPVNRPKVFQTEFMNEQQKNFFHLIIRFVQKLGKDVMNIVDTDKSNSIDFGEFIQILTETDIYFRMNIVF